MSAVQVGCTCLSAGNPLLKGRTFDVGIVDEAGQITLPAVLGALGFVRGFCLVGDHHQLPPLVQNPAAAEQGLDCSLFRRLCEAHPQACLLLIDTLLPAVLLDDFRAPGFAGCLSWSGMPADALMRCSGIACEQSSRTCTQQARARGA